MRHGRTTAAFLLWSVGLAWAIALGVGAAGPAKTELTWYGHAASKIVTPAGWTISIDPWISNPMNEAAKERAADAVLLVKPAMVVSMHFATFPMLSGTPEVFGKALEARGSAATPRTLNVGETLRL